MQEGLLHSSLEWSEKARELQALLDELRPQLIEAEAQLAEQLAAVTAFEYQVRSRLESLNRRLDTLQAEIDELRRALRRLSFESTEWPGGMSHDETGEPWRFEQPAAGAGSYRYHSKTEAPRPSLEGERLVEMKQLYRRLARRFHPDLAIDEIDRSYRTDRMMAINAAYAAGDVETLEQLANEPDSISRRPETPQELAAALEREIERCRRRLAEVAKELATLEKHDSTRLMRRAERAATSGRDLLAELAADLRRRISEKLVERDVLEARLDEAEQEGSEPGADDLADIVYNLGLEQAGEGNLFGSEKEWRRRDPRPWANNDGDDDDAILDDY